LGERGTQAEREDPCIIAFAKGNVAMHDVAIALEWHLHTFGVPQAFHALSKASLNGHANAWLKVHPIENCP
jgi:hypothetical protein